MSFCNRARDGDVFRSIKKLPGLRLGRGKLLKDQSGNPGLLRRDKLAALCELPHRSGS